jgi:hypothetical protein
MRVLVLLAALAVLILPADPARGDKAPDGVPMFTKPAKDPVVEEVSDEEAEELLDALDRAVDEKEEPAILEALKPLVTARHEDFVKPLDKLTKNRSPDIRRAATEALGSQGPGKKVGLILYKVLMNRHNRKEHAVIAAAISSLRRVGFDKKPVYDECESHFRKRNSMDVMRESARYFGDLKKTEAFGMLIEWVEQPQPGNVNDPNNPPAAYWQRMHEIWMEIRLTVMASLKAMTGKEFQLVKEWREWARTPEARRLGID